MNEEEYQDRLMSILKDVYDQYDSPDEAYQKIETLIDEIVDSAKRSVE